MPELPPIQIIGHGLAGAILAETLSGAGYPVQILDDGGPASSRVAAGLYTPLTGRRLVRSWQLESALLVVNRFYPALEKTLGAHFFHPLSSIKIFRSQTEREEWETRKDHDFTREREVSALPFRCPWGGCEVRGGGWVNLPRMLDALKNRRKQKGEWGSLDSPEITIWAEGVKASENPLWRDVGWRNAHGDILTLSIPDLAEEHIYHPGKFLLPVGNHLFRCGATYAWNQKSFAPRQQGRLELETALAEVLTVPFKVVDHQAAIRPVAMARVPVAGPHPEQPEHWIFNGFGSKGVLMAPWMAGRIVEYLQSGAELPKETRAGRRMMRQRDRMKTAQEQRNTF